MSQSKFFFTISFGFDGQCFLFVTELEINFEYHRYSFTEGEAGALDIKVQFRRTQNPFTLILHPVSHREAVERFHVENFIYTPQGEVERATAGKYYCFFPTCFNSKSCTILSTAFTGFHFSLVIITIIQYSSAGYIFVRDGSGDPALSVYIRKMSFSHSI